MQNKYIKGFVIVFCRIIDPVNVCLLLTIPVQCRISYSLQMDNSFSKRYNSSP